MKDFHHLPLGLQIAPLLFKLNPSGNDFILIHIRSGNRQDQSRIIEQITEAWTNLFPEYPFELNFLEDYQFPQERIFISARKIIFFFTVLSILITCMGLIGLSNYMAERRVKEIGIRKTMGSSSLRIIQLLSNEYFLLLVIANILALPAGYLLMNKFLQLFSYRINIGIWSFLVVFISVSMLALLTVSLQSYRTAHKNPAEALRYE